MSAYKAGDWVIVVEHYGWPNDPPVRTALMVVRVMCTTVHVHWHGGGWPMFYDQVRPATLEDRTQGQLAGMEGL